jgi:hypothetical protein
MIKALVLALTLTIAGCSQYRTLVGEEGRKASDAALHDAIWVTCDVSTRGAWTRLFDTREEQELAEAFCSMANK